MGKEHYIQGRKQGEHHFGRHSVQMGLDAFDAKIRAWRDERTQAHLTGHSVEPLDTRLDNSIDDLPQDQEIVTFPQARSHQIPGGVIFEQPEVKKMIADNKTKTTT